MLTRLPTWLLLALVLPGCADLGTALESLWSRPTRYVVERGDTLGEIAKAHGVTVEQLRSWNGIRGDLIEVDQVLLVYPNEGEGLVARSRRARPRPVPTGAHEEPAEPPSRVAIRIDGLAGILGVEGPSGDASGIADAAAGIGSTDASRGPSSRLGDGGSLAGEGTAESLEVAPRGPAPRTPARDPGTPRLDPGLRAPAAKGCLEGPSDVAGDHGIAVAQGLDDGQLRAGLEPVTQRALSCFQAASGRFDVGLELVVGCDGRVTKVEVIDAGGLPETTLDCVTRTVRHAGFDAHARPDGVAVALPLRFEF